MNREKYLLTMLAGIFLFQAAWFTTEMIWCWRHGAKTMRDLGFALNGSDPS